MWFDPGIGYVLPGEVLEYHRAGQVVTVQAVIAGKVSHFKKIPLAPVEKTQINLYSNYMQSKTRVSPRYYSEKGALLNRFWSFCRH